MSFQSPASSVVQSVVTQLQSIENANNYWLAFSGGIDSLVLLHILSTHRHQLNDVNIKAVHVNHSLSKNADQWEQHCRTCCEQWKIEYVSIDVDATPRQGESPEARARTVRYEAISKLVKQGDCLLTAHHQDDQVETLLLQLLRGSGPKGLSAMPELSEFSDGQIARPLINCKRDAIQAYAIKHQLKWIEDESNRDIKYDRNYLRHEVIPKLQQRWPSLSQTVSRSARHCAEAVEILESAAQQGLKKINPHNRDFLSISELTTFTKVEQKNILRYWFQLRGLSTPSGVQLDQVITQVLTASADSSPKLCWEGGEVRRYRDQLYAMSSLGDVTGLIESEPVDWNVDQPLEFVQVGILTAISGEGDGIAKKYLAEHNLRVGFRQGGESIQPVGRKEKHTLKNLFQESGVPPWVRERIPLIYIGDELAAVGNLFISQEYWADDGEDSYRFQWQSVLPGQST